MKQERSALECARRVPTRGGRQADWIIRSSKDSTRGSVGGCRREHRRGIPRERKKDEKDPD